MYGLMEHRLITATSNLGDSLVGVSCVHFLNEDRGALTWSDYDCTSNSWTTVLTSYICQIGELTFYN